MHILAPGLARLPILFVNVYFVGEPGGPWALIDTGLTGASKVIHAAAERRFGADQPPAAIYLTHGHIDHRGGALTLAEEWDVPILAHPAELPFLDGRADYAPKDPTAGSALGFMSLFSRTLPDRGGDLLPYLQPLSAADTPLPGMAGWRWLATPGHSPGHVSFFRDHDGALVAGDALTTTDTQSWTALPLGVRSICPPPLPFTPDWESAQASVQTLAALHPSLLACGHGMPMDEDVSRQLQEFAASFQPPRQGRYAHAPARPIDDAGTIPLPPAPVDPLPAIVGAAALGVVAASWLARRTRDE